MYEEEGTSFVDNSQQAISTAEGLCMDAFSALATPAHKFCL